MPRTPGKIGKKKPGALDRLDAIVTDEYNYVGFKSPAVARGSKTVAEVDNTQNPQTGEVVQIPDFPWGITGAGDPD